MRMIRGLLRYRLMQAGYCARRVLYKAGKTEYLPPYALGRDDFNTYIANLISSNEPFMVGRFGSQEARATAWALGVDRGYDRSVPAYVQRRMAVGPGFFPSDDAHIRRFGLLMAESASHLDALAYWDSFMQQWLLEEVCPKGVVTSRLENLEPYRNQSNPWTRSLKDKKVLIVHPFAKTIESQYAHRCELFANPDLLPEFQLQTLVPPQTIAGNRDMRYDNWFAALDALEAEVDSRDFDVAIIGCGAYGFPLAAHVKRSGLQAVHGGGWFRCCSELRAGAGILSPYRRSFTILGGFVRVRRSDLLTPVRWRTHVTGKARRRGREFLG